MGFTGFPPAALEFYAGLEADNSKAYWTANKAVYEADLRVPMEALSDAVAAEFGPLYLFRPYRDVRFSNDKTPYKTAMGAVTEGEGGAKYYLQISAQGLFAASGYYHLASDQLDRFRAAVAADRTGPALETVVTVLEKARYDIGGEALKVAPRGFPRDHPRVRFLRHKGMTAGRSFPPARWLHTAKALDRVVQVWRDARPLNEWLDANVGPSTLPPPDPR